MFFEIPDHYGDIEIECTTYGIGIVVIIVIVLVIVIIIIAIALFIRFKSKKSNMEAAPIDPPTYIPPPAQPAYPFSKF